MNFFRNFFDAVIDWIGCDDTPPVSYIIVRKRHAAWHINEHNETEKVDELEMYFINDAGIGYVTTDEPERAKHFDEYDEAAQLCASLNAAYGSKNEPEPFKICEV